MSNKKKFKELLVELIEVPEEAREKEILEILDNISPDPQYLNYVFCSEEFYFENGDVDIDGVIKKIFSYKPTLL